MNHNEFVELIKMEGMQYHIQNVPWLNRAAFIQQKPALFSKQGAAQHAYARESSLSLARTPDFKAL